MVEGEYFYCQHCLAIMSPGSVKLWRGIWIHQLDRFATAQGHLGHAVIVRRADNPTTLDTPTDYAVASGMRLLDKSGRVGSADEGSSVQLEPSLPDEIEVYEFGQSEPVHYAPGYQSTPIGEIEGDECAEDSPEVAKWKAKYREAWTRAEGLQATLDEDSVPVYRGWHGYGDGSRTDVERWVRATNGDWVSLDSERRTDGDIILEHPPAAPEEKK